MAVHYRVRRLSPDSARDHVLRVWRDNLAVEGDRERHFRWAYNEAPERPDSVFVLSSDVYEDRAAVVGSAGLGVRRMQIGGEMRRAALMADLAVDPGHRTLWPALRLVREAHRFANERFALAYGMPNDRAAGLFLRSGYHKLGTMTRLVCVLRHAPYLSQIVATPRLTGLAGRVADLACLAVPTTRAAFETATGVRLQWLWDVDDRFDNLWMAARRDYDVVGERSSEFLRWRFVRHPCRRVRFAALRTRAHPEEIRAYAAIELQEEQVILRDLFGLRGELPVLIDRLRLALWRAGHSSLSIRLLDSSPVAAWLRGLGFKPRGKPQVLVVSPGAGYSPERLCDPQRWYLTDADEDTN